MNFDLILRQYCERQACDTKACFDLLRERPENAEALHLLAEIHRFLGDIPGAIGYFTRVCRIRPDDAASRRRLADTCLAGGDLPGAAANYRVAIQLEPSNARAHSNLGLTLARAGDRTEAEASYRRALALDPDYSIAHNNLGNLLRFAGNWSGALACYERALAVSPALIEAWTSRAAMLVNLGRCAEAIDCSQRALALRNDDAEALSTLATALHRLGRIEDALAACRRTLARVPDRFDALELYANLSQRMGDRRAAVVAYRRLLEIRPDNPAARMGLAIAQIPVVGQSEVEVGRARQEFSAQLEALEQWLATRGGIEAPELFEAPLPFFLAYQIEDNRDLLAAYGRICTRNMAAWLERQDIARPAAVPPRDTRLRVGIVSAFVGTHSVYHAIIDGWLKALDAQRFEVTIFSLNPHTDADAEFARGACARFEQGPRPLIDWVAAIRACGADVLLYPEIGMDPQTLQLASMRLAPTQVASWGHPETSGLSTIDYYLSAEGFETDESSGWYCEKLVRLPNLGTYVEPFGIEPQAVPEALAPEEGGPVFVCPGTPFKYAPGNDHIFLDIARRLGRCRFLFFEFPPTPSLSDRLLRRLSAVFGEAGLDATSYLRLRPWATPAEFTGLMRRADVLLDTIGFSGFNTVMHAVEADLPIVTQDGRFLRGRFGAAILRQLGLAEYVAHDGAAYVEAAVRLAGDAALREAVRARMRAHKGVLYRDAQVKDAFARFLLNLQS